MWWEFPTFSKFDQPSWFVESLSIIIIWFFNVICRPSRNSPTSSPKLRLQIRKVVMFFWSDKCVIWWTLLWPICGTIRQKNPSIHVASRWISSGTAAATLRYATAMRTYSTSFMEERDTFGPIQVSSGKYMISFFVTITSWLSQFSSMSYQPYSCYFCVRFWGAQT